MAAEGFDCIALQIYINVLKLPPRKLNIVNLLVVRRITACKIPAGGKLQFERRFPSLRKTAFRNVKDGLLLSDMPSFGMLLTCGCNLSQYDP